MDLLEESSGALSRGPSRDLWAGAGSPCHTQRQSSRAAQNRVSGTAGRPQFHPGSATDQLSDFGQLTAPL